MSTFSSAMLALAGPVAKKVMQAVGIGVITYAGLDTATSAALAAAKSNMAGIPADIAAVAAISGIFTAMSVVAGGITAGLSLVALERFGKIAS